ncbi:Protein lethal(2)essential for life [Eumeta japonica]|uniref:Protein lethal(2)essential for life n=1 Tax=Eumeta variegata TaxID=151549 RepID=A0A4C1Z367_EUMVA|nr:Protein lethal(2)essential for life [Eumeta japonica]
MNTLRGFLFVVLLASCCSASDEREPRGRKVLKYEDPFASFDRHVSHALAYHYLWPWSQLFKAAAALDGEDALEEPQIYTDPEKFEISLNVRHFKPDELRVRVKNRYIIVEGKHKESNEDHKHFITNHFVQRFALPAGSKSEEVTAVLKANGVLSVSAPKHELPPPPPEREVPIEVLKPAVVDDKTEEFVEKKPEPIDNSTEKKAEEPSSTVSTPLEQLDLVEATTHVGKIRKKELKTSTKTAKDNEVTKGVDNNGLDYALVETEDLS